MYLPLYRNTFEVFLCKVSLKVCKVSLAGAFAKKYFQCISILASVLFVLYREALVI